MKNLKTLINVLLIVLPTSGAASTMSCDRYGYTAYEYLWKYNSNLVNNQEIAYWSMGDNWTGAKTGMVQIENTTNANIRVHLLTVTCGNIPQSQCRRKTPSHDSGLHTLAAYTVTQVPVTYEPNPSGTYRGIIYLAPESYIMDSVNTANGNPTLKVYSISVDSQHPLTYTWFEPVLVQPKVVGQTSLTLPDAFVYDTPLDTGVDANTSFPLTNSTAIPITLKVDKILGDNTFVTVGNETLTEGDRSRPITGKTTVGLYLPDHAEPGTKSANVVASWTCP